MQSINDYCVYSKQSVDKFNTQVTYALARVKNPQKTIINLGQTDINSANRNKPIHCDIYHQN